MLSSIIPPSVKVTSKPPILDERILKRYVNAEYDRMILEVQSLIRAKIDNSRGNKFAQIIHDGCTLDNGFKVQSVGLQFVDPKFRTNHVLCLCCRVCPGNLGVDISKFIQDVSLEVLGQELAVICDSSVQDRAALSVSNHLGITEAEPCDMHDGDKIGRSAIGELTRSNKKVVINPFVEGKALMKRFQDLGKHFSSTEKNRLNYAAVLNQHPELPTATIQRDLNKTRIEARHKLLQSSLRVIKG